MEVIAKHVGANISAQKARLVADQIRGKSVGEALNILAFSTRKVHTWSRRYSSPPSRTRSTTKVPISTSCACQRFSLMRG